VNVELRPLAPNVGAEVLGVDAAASPNDELVATLRNALASHGVLLLRKQQLDADQHRRFMRGFGELSGYSGAFDERTRGKDVIYVGNIVVDGERGGEPNGELTFHADGFQSEAPDAAVSLYGIEIPASGGNTLFASTGRAYAALAPELQARLLGLDVRCGFNYDRAARTGRRRRGTVAERGEGPSFVHPLVMAHPRSGRPLLNANRLMAEYIIGLAPVESDALIAQLCGHVRQPQFVYEHFWRPGDLIIWDNLATVHARTDFDPTQRRWLRRISVKGTRPIAARSATA
jgi:taurine dioxygenase